MYKLSIKIEDAGSAEYQMAYQFLHDIIDDLVFCGNLAAHIPAGTDSVIFDCERDAIKAAAEEIWRGDRDLPEPDRLLKIEWVSGWDGRDDNEKAVPLTKQDMAVIVAALTNQAAELKSAALTLEDNRDKESAELLRRTADQCRDAMHKLLRHMNPNA